MSGLLALWVLGCVPDLADNDLPSNPDHDHDGDGYVESPTGDPGGDCDDEDPDVHPGALELCNDTDNDCDGRIDEDAVDAVARYMDEDLDGYGTLDDSILACHAVEGFSDSSDDCDDHDPDVNPGADEVCEDGADNNCDGVSWCELVDGMLRLEGVRSDDHAGHAVAGGTDLDGDGHDDVIVGAPENDGDSALNTTNFGATYVFYGPITGETELSLGQADERLLGVELGRAGQAVSGVGDVDGRGLPDLFIGSPGPGASSDEARVHLVYGEDLGDEEDLSRHLTWTGATAIVEGVGASVGGGGDMDGDGIPELLVGSEAALSEPGAVWLIWGADATTSSSLDEAGVSLRSTREGDKTGSVVRDMGDMDGDGLADFGIGAPRWGDDESGAVILVSSMDIAGFGAGDAFSLDDAITIPGSEAGSRWGGALAGGHDVTGDGLNDFFVGSAGFVAESEQTGAVSLILGSRGGRGPPGYDTLITGLGEGHSFGAAMDLADFDGDGVPDLIVGAPARGSSNLTGGIYAFLGPVAGLGTLSGDDADWRHADAAVGSDAGATLGVVQGALGEGAAVLLGMPRWSAESTDAGAAVVVPY